MYAGYLEKDQATLGPAALGHTHDWEHVIAWISDNQVQYVSVSQHSSYLVSHEPPENGTGGWFYPRLVGWEGYPAGYRDKLMNADFGEATIKIKGDSFNDNLACSKPSGIPVAPTPETSTHR